MIDRSDGERRRSRKEVASPTAKRSFAAHRAASRRIAELRRTSSGRAGEFQSFAGKKAGRAETENGKVKMQEIMTEGWKIAERPRRRGRPSRRDRIYVSLNKRGEIVLNDTAWRHIGRPYNATLLFDAANGQLGVKAPVPADRFFFPVRRYGRGGRNRIIRAKRMMDQFGIEISGTLVFDGVRREMLRGEPMLVMSLLYGHELGSAARDKGGPVRKDHEGQDN